jgi:O-acetyl-ADP-ribose deacetylase (regulator of RNase III)
MRVEIITGDITKLNVDAIVNAANNSLTGGGGVDGAIHRAAGLALREYCINLRGCETGDAKITPGFNLTAKFIIHAVGPVWNNGTTREESLLASCYKKSLDLAVENDITTIAFPCISTGAYRFPFDKAAEIALTTIGIFLNTNDSIKRILMVTYDTNDFRKYKRAYDKLGFRENRK